MPPAPTTAAVSDLDLERWLLEDTSASFAACDAVFGSATTVVALATLIFWFRGDVSTTTLVLVWLFPICNMALTPFGKRGRARAELVRLAVNTPLTFALHVCCDGQMRGLWLPLLIMAAGGGLAWPSITRRARHGYAVTLWYVGILVVAAAVGGQPLMPTIWRSLALGVVGFVMATIVTRLVAAAIEARVERAEALAHKRDLERSLAALADRTRDLRLVLDSVAQGFVTIDRDGAITGERSAIVDHWFGPPDAGGTFAAMLARHDPEVARWFVLGLESLREGHLPPELVLDQLPRRLVAGGRTFDLEYRPIARDERDRMVLIVSDVTEHIERERAERAQRETIALFQRITTDRAGFDEFMEEANALVASLAVAGDPEAERRALHTLKGTCSIYGLDGYAELCHRLEQELADTDQPLDLARRGALIDAWREQTTQVQRLLGDHRRHLIEVSPPELASVCDRAWQGVPSRELAAVLTSWWHEPVARRFERLGKYAASLGRRLDKGELDVEVAADGVRLDSARWSPFWGALVHAVRNAVDHGIDSPRARAAAGKPARPHLALTATRTHGQLVISVSDDGAGIDWELVRARARALGRRADSHEDLTEALFADGFSTRATVTPTSGRGVGLAALRATVDQLGGRVELDSLPGLGTTLRCRFPDLSRALAARQPSQPLRILA